MLQTTCLLRPFVSLISHGFKKVHIIKYSNYKPFCFFVSSIFLRLRALLGTVTDFENNGCLLFADPFRGFDDSLLINQ